MKIGRVAPMVGNLIGRFVGTGVVALLCVLAVAPTAQATSLAQARLKARQVASRQVERYGITYPVSDWAASCARRSVGGFSCRVRTTTTGQCAGTLRLSGRLRSFAVRIGCGE